MARLFTSAFPAPPRRSPNIGSIAADRIATGYGKTKCITVVWA
jgi:hypothetical protein